MFDLVYYYHHPDEIPAPIPQQEQDGFHNPSELVIAGWAEWKKTGIRPDPDDLAKRLRRRWINDLDTLDAKIEQGRPKPPPIAT